MSKHRATGMRPHFDDVQAHYDLSDEFFQLFLDPTRTYSCAYFVRDDMTLQEAQVAKIDLALSKLNLRSGMSLLDIGCGWGATMLRAVDQFDVDVTGLTLSRNQATFVEELLAGQPGPRDKRVLLEGWEQFDGHADRIVSIGAFEHFGKERYDDFFDFAHRVLPDDGVMLLHTITQTGDVEAKELELKLNMPLIRFVKFILTEIFPGGRLPSAAEVEEYAQRAGFRVTRVHSLRPHYAKTLDLWAAALSERRDEAIAIQSEEVYDRYMKYLTGCAELFHNGYTDVCQFTLEKG